MFRGFIVSAIRTVVSAFSQAYRNAAYAGAKGAPESGAAAVNRMMKKPLTIEEARQILEVPEDISATQLKERYDKLMAANSVEAGGSFYLQSKVFRAKQRIDMEMAKSNPEGMNESQETHR